MDEYILTEKENGEIKKEIILSFSEYIRLKRFLMNDRDQKFKESEKKKFLQN